MFRFLNAVSSDRACLGSFPVEGERCRVSSWKRQGVFTSCGFGWTVAPSTTGSALAFPTARGQRTAASARCGRDGTTVERDGCVDGGSEAGVPPCDGDGAQLDESPRGLSNREEVHV